MKMNIVAARPFFVVTECDIVKKSTNNRRADRWLAHGYPDSFGSSFTWYEHRALIHEDIHHPDLIADTITPRSLPGW
jgi:hypothetical protein